MLIDDRQMHLQIKAGEVGRYVILPGDPGRCEKIARYFENPREIAYNREFKTVTGTLDGVPVSVCSTGIGGPSAAIALEELVECGADTFIRVGTTGGMQPSVHGGDIIVATAAVRMEGTSREYMPIEFPAAADFDVSLALREAAKKLSYPCHMGVIQSKDSFYGQIRPEQQPVGELLMKKWDAWKAAGVLSSEMETAALFVASRVRHVRCGAVLNVIWNTQADEAPQLPPDAAERGIRTAVEALRLLIVEDRHA